jgi:hypothetical protein
MLLKPFACLAYLVDIKHFFPASFIPDFEKPFKLHFFKLLDLRQLKLTQLTICFNET